MSDLTRRIAELSPEKRHRLLQQLQEKDAAKQPSIHPHKRDESFLPLSFAQQRLWFLDQLEPASDAYLLPTVRRLRFAVNPIAFERSLQALTARHEILRTTFSVHAGQPVQVIHPPSPFHLPLVDLSELTPEAQAMVTHQLIEQDAHQACDLEQGPLFRAFLLYRQTQDYVLLMTMHHSIADAWSREIIVRELTVLYQAFTSQRSLSSTSPLPLSLPPLPIQYADFALWQRQWLQGAILAQQTAYWRQQLTGATSTELPTDHPRPAVQTFRGLSIVKRLSPALQDQLVRLCQQEGVTQFMFFLASFQVLLARYSNQTDISLGSPIANRTRPELEHLIGFFVNTLVLRIDLAATPSFRSILQRVKKMVLDAHAHQDLPFEHLVEILQPDRDLSRLPFFQIMFSVQQNTVAPEQEAQVFSETGTEHTTTKFDLTVNVASSPQHLSCGIEYNTDLYDTSTIEQLLEHWQQLLESIAAQPSASFTQFTIIPVSYQKMLIHMCNSTRTSYPTTFCIQELFEQQTLDTPDAIALHFHDEQLSYQCLNTRVQQVAWHLQSTGLQPEAMVGICLERSLELPLCLLAILQAGGVYVPLDPGYPQERLAFMAHDTHMSLLLTSRSQLAHIPSSIPHILCIEDVPDSPRSGENSHSRRAMSAQQLAYVMYTSGSTGLPKGVAVSHKNVVRLVKKTNYVKLDRAQVFLQLAPVSFDASTLEIWGALLNGARLTIFPPELPSLAALGEALQRYQISILWLTAGLFHQMVEEQLATLSQVQHLLAGGDVLSVPHVMKVKQAFPACEVINGYGPTEGTTFTCCYSVPANITGTSIPIGKPIANTEVYILDRWLNLAPLGSIGDLYIGGDGLARGYLHRPGLTAERFIPHPWAMQPGKRLYRSGDRVRYRKDGTIEFSGRSDFQVKLRGFRVEPGEIETILSAALHVQQCLVLVHEDQYKERRLVAYVTSSEPDAQIVAEELRTYLQAKVPDYMIPTYFVRLDAFPLTVNGKVDRHALPFPEPVKTELVGNDPAMTPIEEMIALIWSEVLGCERVTTHDNFFLLGGHSLLATRLISRMRTALQVEIPLRSIFEAPTVAGLAQHVQQELHRGSNPLPPLVPVPRTQYIPLSFAQQRLWFFDRLQPEDTSYLMPSIRYIHGELNAKALEQSFTEIVKRHETLRTTFQEQRGVPFQVIHTPETYCLPFIDLHSLAETERLGEAQRLSSQEKSRYCNLIQGPLLRSYLLSLQPQEHLLLVTLHHIISDGWSNDLFNRELGIFYQAFKAGQSPQLSPLTIQYTDFALWQRQWLQGRVLDDQIAYWKRQLLDVAPLEFPFDHPRSTLQAFKGIQVTEHFPRPLYERLRLLSRRQEVTLFMLLLASFQVVLARYTGQRDICVGTVIANRSQVELEDIIGFFVNTLALRIELAANPTFIEVLQKVREVTLGAYMHQDVPFEQLVSKLNLDHDLNRHPLFQVTFRLQPRSAQEPIRERPQNASLLPIHMDTEYSTAKFDLSVAMKETDDGLLCGVTYNTSLLEQNTVKRLLKHWSILLEGIVAAPETPIAALPLLTETERAMLLYLSQAPSRPLHEPANMMALLLQQVESTPEASALVWQEQTLSYAALWQRICHLADWLSRSGVLPYDRVALWVPRSGEGLQGLLAIWLVGGTLLPLDQTMPPQRLQAVLHKSAARFLLSSHMHVPPLNATTSLPGTVQMLLLEDGLSEGLKGEATRSDYAGLRLQGGDPLYLLFTSGSTGAPKGVLLSQQALLNRLCWGIEQVGMQPGERLGQVAAWSFDIALWELIAPLLAGGCVVLLPGSQVQESVALLRRLQEEQITLLHLVPSLLRVVVQEPELEQIQSLRWLLCGGEEVSQHLLQQVRKRLPVGIQQYYGPTEGAISVTCWQVESQQEIKRVCLGHPINNTQVYVLDQQCQQIPAGVYGELVLGGIAVAEGYVGSAELTAERFVPDPFSKVAGARLYRTGDRGRWIEGGELEYGGRQDRQIKLRGHRIEPGEVEAALERHEQVREAIVEVRKVAEEKQLVAYVVLQLYGTVTGEQLRTYVREHLPEYAVPGIVMQLEHMPLTSHGKINRKALPEPVQQQEEKSSELTPLEELLGNRWCEMLGREQIGRDEDFFEMGGHSLLTMRVIAWIRNTLSIEIPVQAMFEAPTLREFAEVVDQKLRRADNEVLEPALVVVERSDHLPLSFAQQRLWFMDQLEPGNIAYLMPAARSLQGILNLHALACSLQELVWRHESLRTTFATHDGKPVQVIHPPSTFYLPIIDLHSLPIEQRSSIAHHLAQQEAQQPCNLSSGPLFRLALLRMHEQQHTLLMTLHHIIFDGWSDTILARELSMLYKTFNMGATSQLPPLPIQYADYATWQRNWLQGEVLQTQLKYWRQQLKGVTPLKLPVDHHRPAIQSYRGAAYHFSLTHELSQALISLSRKESSTLFMTLLTTFQILFYRYSGQIDIVLGTDIANRRHVETEGIIGFFVNLLVLRTNLSDRPTFRTLLKQVREMVLAAYAHQDTPFELLVERLVPEHTLDRMPLVQVLFVLQNLPFVQKRQALLASEDQQARETRPHHGEHKPCTAKFDLALFMLEDADQMHGALTYKLDLFEPTTIATMMRHFTVLLHSAVQQPDTPIDLLAFQSDEELVQQKQESKQLQQALRIRKGERFDVPGSTLSQPKSITSDPGSANLFSPDN